MANSDLQTSLREGGRAGESGKSVRLRNVLAVGEIALAMVLLVGAGLLLRSFAKLTAVSPGFDVQHVVKAEIALPRVQYSTPQKWNAFAEGLMQRIQAEPGLRDSAVVIPTPIANGFINLGFDVMNGPAAPPGVARAANSVAASPGYFRVMGIPRLEDA